MKALKTYYIKTYGCAMNYADSERIRYILNAVGLKETKDFKKSDIIILNSCSVRKQAEDKISGWGLKRKKYGLEEKIFVLTGCMAVRKNRNQTKSKKIVNYVQKLKDKYSWMNYFVDIKDIVRLPEILDIQNFGESYESYLNIMPSHEGQAVAHIPISTGCNFFCSYCIVPFSRGELLHRNYEEILNEVQFNLDNGVKLIYLVAQNVNSWRGFKEGKKIGFADLLKDVANIDGQFWVTFVSSNPMDFSDEIIEAIASNEKIMRWLNIAVQSGSDNILKNMNRKYSVKGYESLIEKITEEIPNVRLTTDIIVGFPGETLDDFQKTFDLTKKLKFQMLYVGKYSPREGTVSSKLEDDVPIEEKKRREDLLKDDLNAMRKKFHDNLVGQEMEILVTGGRRGLSYFYHEILFEEPITEGMIGQFVKAKIVKGTLSGLIAKV